MNVDRWTETCPVQPEPSSSSLTCVYTDRSEQIHTSQPECPKLANREVLFGPKKLQTWIPHLCKKRISQRRGRHFVYVGLAFAFGDTLSGSSGLVFPFSVPQAGDSGWHWLLAVALRLYGQDGDSRHLWPPKSLEIKPV